MILDVGSDGNMAEIRSIYTDKRKTADRRKTGYVDGATVRKLQTEERQERSRRNRTGERVHTAHRPAKKEQRMSIGYTLFLATASALALWICTGYLQLQADNTARAKNIAALESQLADLKTENDDEYNRVVTSVDLEKIRDIAINELGMVYADQDQVILYDGEGSDYVKQYADIPEDEKSLKGLLGTISR